ncbi:MAG: RadC family protein [Deltaproteobacteria bacterium]
MGTDTFVAVKAWAPEERPREKMLKDGEHRLSDTELLAVLLRTGTRGKSSVDLARALLARFGGLRQIAQAPMPLLQEMAGMGPAKVCQVRAALEIGRRAAEEKAAVDGDTIGSPGDVCRLLSVRMASLRKEVFKMLALDSQNRVIRIVEVEEGTVNYASPILREVFQKAIENFASSIVCVHNHPSGDPSPSSEDRRFTEALVSAGRILQVAVLDHIIIGGRGYFSFADEGLIKAE